MDRRDPSRPKVGDYHACIHESDFPAVARAITAQMRGLQVERDRSYFAGTDEIVAARLEAEIRVLERIAKLLRTKGVG